MRMKKLQSFKKGAKILFSVMGNRILCILLPETNSPRCTGQRLIGRRPDAGCKRPDFSGGIKSRL
jgi:hypothetical protein